MDIFIFSVLAVAKTQLARDLFILRCVESLQEVNDRASITSRLRATQKKVPSNYLLGTETDSSLRAANI